MCMKDTPAKTTPTPRGHRADVFVNVAKKPPPPSFNISGIEGLGNDQIKKQKNRGENRKREDLTGTVKTLK